MSARATLLALKPPRSGDPYILRQLALATYKRKKPDVPTALREARTTLQELDPERSSDPETRGLWGAVHKRLWETESDRAALETAIRAYEKGFHLKDDYYNGINYAFLLNVRATLEAPERWMPDSRNEQVAKLEALLAQNPLDKIPGD